MQLNFLKKKKQMHISLEPCLNYEKMASELFRQLSKAVWRDHKISQVNGKRYHIWERQLGLSLLFSFFANVERGGASNTHVSVYLVFLCLQFVFLYLNFGREVQHLSVKSTSLPLTRSLQIHTVQLYLCIHVFIILCF